MPGLFLSVVSFVPHDYYLVDSSSPICASSMDGYLLLWWRWFGVLVLALQVGTACLRPGMWVVRVHRSRMLFTGRARWMLYWVFGPESQRDTGIRCVMLCRKKWRGQWWALAMSTRVSVHTWQHLSFFSSWGEQFSLDAEHVSHQAVVRRSQPLQYEGFRLTSCCAFPRCALSTSRASGGLFLSVT